MEKLDDVEEAIRTHQPKDDPEIIEAVLLRDADILEQLGAIGAIRTFAKVGRDTQLPKFLFCVTSFAHCFKGVTG